MFHPRASSLKNSRHRAGSDRAGSDRAGSDRAGSDRAGGDRAGGDRMAFRDWMEQALYHPDQGYYSRHVRGVGRRGDFTTSAKRGERLASAIAHWILREQARHGGARLPLIEIGPGDGSLAVSVLKKLGQKPVWHPGRWFGPRWQLHLVDVSPPLRLQQQELLRSFGSRVRWHTSMTEAVAATGGRGLIWSNELIDAFPATVLRWDPGDPPGWQELAIEIDSRGLREFWKKFEPRSGLTGSALDPAAWPGGSPPPGQRVEWHDSVISWLRSWMPQWREGSLLTIDYGQEFPRIYHRRPRGSVRAYTHHQRLEGSQVYHRQGRQDLTADVNFTDLVTWTENLGLETTGLISQADFIAEATDPSLEETTPPADTAADEAFLVLKQRRPRPAAP